MTHDAELEDIQVWTMNQRREYQEATAEFEALVELDYAMTQYFQETAQNPAYMPFDNRLDDAEDVKALLDDELQALDGWEHIKRQDLDERRELLEYAQQQVEEYIMARDLDEEEFIEELGIYDYDQPA